MRYAPYPDEYASVADMGNAQLLEYFLTRIFETEEVWVLDDGIEWLLDERGERLCMPVWPYKKYAAECAIAEWGHYTPAGLSLEVFMQQALEFLTEEDAVLEVMPRPGAVGCTIRPSQLISILEGMIDAGEYRMDG